MKKFTVQFTEIVRKEIVIEAEDEEQAEKMVETQDYDDDSVSEIDTEFKSVDDVIEINQ
jgi:hypothetical protein